MLLPWVPAIRQAANNKYCYTLVLIDLTEALKNMNISLTPVLEHLVKSKVESGLYHSASEVMREALRLLEERDQLRELRLRELRSDIQKGIDSGPARPLDMKAIKARGRQKLAAQQGAG
jgi:antitoxin ParD1/3/4